MKQAMDEDH